MLRRHAPAGRARPQPPNGPPTGALSLLLQKPNRSGRITAYRSPGGHGIRLDGAMAAGNIVSRHYDSLVGHLTAVFILL